MTANVKLYSVGVAEYIFYAKKNGNYPYGITGTISNGSDASMGRYTGLASIAITAPEAPTETIQADGGVMGQFKGQALDPITGQLVMKALDLNFHKAAEGRSIYADGDHDAMIYSQSCINYGQLALVINMRAKSMASGSVGENGWFVVEMFNVEAQAQFPSFVGNAFAAVDFPYSLTLNTVDTELNGVSFSNGTNYGKKNGVMKYYWSEYPVHFHTHVGNAADTGVTLTYTPAADNTNKVKAWKNGVAVTYGAGAGNFTNTGTAITFGTAPGAGEKTVIRYEFNPDC